jgi:hypothetical protein
MLCYVVICYEQLLCNVGLMARADCARRRYPHTPGIHTKEQVRPSLVLNKSQVPPPLACNLSTLLNNVECSCNYNSVRRVCRWRPGSLS